MSFLEKTLEEIIFESRNRKYGRGLTCCLHDLMYRQVNLKTYGIVDLIGISISKDEGYRTIKIVVYELKKDLIDYSTIGQACRYISGIQEYYRARNTDSTIIKIEACIIGSKIQISGDFAFTLGRIGNIRAYTYQYDFDGIKFKEENGYSYTDGSCGEHDGILKEISKVSFNTSPFDLPF